MRDIYRTALWQRSHALTLAIYRHTGCFPPEERAALAAHLRQTAVSLPLSLARCGCADRAEVARHLHQALTAASELDYLLRLAADLGYLDDLVYDSLHPQLSVIQQTLILTLQGLNLVLVLCPMR
jgi:four helix bundle protein